jgi:hypothetical protein
MTLRLSEGIVLTDYYTSKGIKFKKENFRLEI